MVVLGVDQANYSTYIQVVLTIMQTAAFTEKSYQYLKRFLRYTVGVIIKFLFRLRSTVGLFLFRSTQAK